MVSVQDMELKVMSIVAIEVIFYMDVNQVQEDWRTKKVVFMMEYLKKVF